jgi:hypothetical protein
MIEYERHTDERIWPQVWPEDWCGAFIAHDHGQLMPDHDHISIGARVLHIQWGTGSVFEKPADDRSRVRFDRGDVRTVLDSFLRKSTTGSPQYAQMSAPVPAREPVRLLTYSEFKAQIRTPGVYLVKGLVRPGTLIAVGGRPGCGKTALMVELARLLDAGLPFLERETTAATVVYIAAEDADDVSRRLEAVSADGVLIMQSDEGLPLTKPDKAKAIVKEAIRQARERMPDRPVFVVVDTLRAALGGQSVLEDRFTSPALNALRELAEDEGAVVAVLNHTNRENVKATKGETLEAVASLELVLLAGEGEWFAVHVGKNRSGPAHRQIGRVRYTSVEVGGLQAAVVDELVAEGPTEAQEKERKPGAKQMLVLRILQTEIIRQGEKRRPFGNEGPEVKAVREPALRDEFISAKAGDSRDTKAKAFLRAMDWLIKREDIVRREDGDGVGWVWFGNRAAETGHFEV